MTLATVHSAEEWIARFGEARKPVALAIGNFDGMHRGHQEILRRVIERARRTKQTAAVLTFYPHPARVLRPAESPSLLATLEQRLGAFDAIGIDAALVMEFTAELAQVSPEEFARHALAETMRARAVLVGKNFRFGHRQSGDLKLLEEFGRRWGFDVDVVPPVMDGGIVISSTQIRQAVRDGRMEDAKRMLGRPFALEGEVQPGMGLGRKVVVATLNLKTQQATLPKNGVYATETVAREKTYRSVTNVGVRPTFDGARVSIESHLFDFDEDWTNGGMEVRFLTRLRDEQKFSGPEALREQVMRDIEHAKEFFRQDRDPRL
jgi:riboflavin kinase/FMN adenylyltransferase